MLSTTQRTLGLRAFGFESTVLAQMRQGRCSPTPPTHCSMRGRKFRRRDTGRHEIGCERRKLML